MKSSSSSATGPQAPKMKTTLLSSYGFTTSKQQEGVDIEVVDRTDKRKPKVMKYW